MYTVLDWVNGISLGIEYTTADEDYDAALIISFLFIRIIFQWE